MANSPRLTRLAGSLLAGQRMAGIMSLLQTAKLNGIEPFTWLHFVLTHIPTWKNSQLDDLLPFAKNTFAQPAPIE